MWSYKRAKIKKETPIGPKEKGGLDMPELHSTSKALKVAWVKRMLEDNINDWMAIPLYYLRHVGGTLTFECDYDVNCLNINELPHFYHEVLVAWSQVQALNSASRNVRTTDIIWNNKNIKIAGKSVYFRDWHQVGIKTIKDLLNEKSEFLPYHSFCESSF